MDAAALDAGRRHRVVGIDTELSSLQGPRRCVFSKGVVQVGVRIPQPYQEAQLLSSGGRNVWIAVKVFCRIACIQHPQFTRSQEVCFFEGAGSGSGKKTAAILPQRPRPKIARYTKKIDLQFYFGVSERLGTMWT